MTQPRALILAPARLRERSMSLPATCQFNQEINTFTKQKQYDLAIDSFNRMVAARISPDVVTYNTMINLYVKTQRLSDAFDLLKVMKSQRIAPTIVTYTSLVDGCGKCNAFDKALELYAEVRSLDIPQNPHFFNALLNAGFLNGDLGAVDALLEDLANESFRKNVITYNTLVAGFLKFRLFRRIVLVIAEMSENDIEFLPATHLNLLRCSELVVTKSDIADFVKILKISQAEPGPGETAQCVIDLTTKRQLVLAHELCKSFVENQFEIGLDGLRALLSLAGEFANFVVLKWVHEYCGSPSIAPEQAAATLSSYARFGNLDMVRATYSDAICSVPAKLNAVNCLLAHSDDSALAIARNIAQDPSCTATDADRLLQMLSDRNRDSEVVELFHLIKRNVVRIGTQGSDCVIKAFMRTHIDADSIFQLKPSLPSIIKLVEMAPPEVAASIPWSSSIEGCSTATQPSLLFELMNGLMRKGQHAAAWFAFSHFVKLGVSPSGNSIELALQSLTPTNHHENLVFLLDTVRATGEKPSSELASRVIVSAIERGDLAQAFQVNMEMDGQGIEMSPQAKAMFASRFGDACARRPHMRMDGEQLKERKGSRTRLRSRSFPNHSAGVDQWSGMEEISFRSAFLAVGTEDV